MEFVGESEAKAIVRGFMRTYTYSTINLVAALEEMWRNTRNPSSILKREEIIKKNFKKFGGDIYFQQVGAQFSTTIALAVGNKRKNADNQSLSHSQRKKNRLADKKYKSYQRALEKQCFNIFAVKEIGNTNLSLIMFDPRAKDQHDLKNIYSIATITRHCLERVVERMNLKSVDKALEEIVSSLQWLETSNKELLGRPVGDGEAHVFKRHIPTANGALLLKNYPRTNSGTKPILESQLVTWIHKNQFYKGQEVTTKDFNFVQAVNYVLSNPNKANEINKYNEGVKNLSENLGDDDFLVVNINGEMYPWERFISALESDKYLDFIVDFENNR